MVHTNYLRIIYLMVHTNHLRFIYESLGILEQPKDLNIRFSQL